MLSNPNSTNVTRVIHITGLHSSFCFLPVCVLRCLCSSSLLVNLLPQKIQLQTNGLSPVCQRRWALRWDVLPYTFPQPSIWQMCCFFFVGSPLFLQHALELGFWIQTFFFLNVLTNYSSKAEYIWLVYEYSQCMFCVPAPHYNVKCSVLRSQISHFRIQAALCSDHLSNQLSHHDLTVINNFGIIINL